MSYLLDTNVVSELRKPFGRIDVHVAAWGASLAADEQFLSVITLFEVELGIRRVERRDTPQARALRRWFDTEPFVPGAPLVFEARAVDR